MRTLIIIIITPNIMLLAWDCEPKLNPKNRRMIKISMHTIDELLKIIQRKIIDEDVVHAPTTGYHVRLIL